MGARLAVQGVIFALLALSGVSLAARDATKQPAEHDSETRNDAEPATYPAALTAVLETPYLCRLGKQYPWIRRFIEEKVHKYPEIEWRETGGNPRLLVLEGNALKRLVRLRNGADIEEQIRKRIRFDEL